MNIELSICLDEAEKEIFSAVGGIMKKHNLPCFLVEPIIDKVHRMIVDGKNKDLAEARAREATKEKEQ